MPMIEKFKDDYIGNPKNELFETSKAIDAYIEKFPEPLQRKLIELREYIKSIVPEAKEKISYGMPAVYVDKILVYYAGFKHHIGFYPTASGIAAFENELGKYKHSKGAIQFKIDEELPKTLIHKIVLFRLNETTMKGKSP